MAKRILIALGVLLLIVVLSLGYLGFMPWLSSVFGSDRPRDLGVRAMPQDLDSAMTKLAVQAMPPVVDEAARQQMIAEASKTRPGSSVFSAGSKTTPAPQTPATQPTTGTKGGSSAPITSGTYISVLVDKWQPKNVDVVLTSEEITALLQTGTWKTWPVSNAQLRINPDGSAEMVGMINITRLQAFAAMTGIPSATLDDFFNYIHFRHNFPFYVKSRGQVINNQVQMTLEKVEIGRLSIPASVLTQYQGEITNFVQSYLIQGGIAQKKKFDVKTIRAENGKLKFQGTLPSASPHWSYKKVEDILGQQ
ncbi:MAG TPA: hypothetical protein VN426_11710 [Syntrophomonadaceae bacterium]|nr:hypothetical protein [Syntrophomonadaceae bacterium]